MENEYFDEPRKCPNCSIVTYCDSCPTCGRRLPRSSAEQWKRVYGHRIAGEEAGILQPDDIAGKHQHIDIRDSQSGNQSFEKAKHREPSVKFYSNNSQSNDPFSKSGELKKANNGKGVFILIIAIVIVIAIFITLLSVGLEKIGMYVGNNHDITYVQSDLNVGNTDSMQLSEYVYDQHNEEATFRLENTGEQAISTTIEFYEEGQKQWSEYNVFILPNEAFDYTIYIKSDVDSYSFVDVEFFTINAMKPAFDFTIFNDYGYVIIETNEDNLQKDDIRMLTKYVVEATSYDDFAKTSAVTLYDGNDFVYEIYINGNTADVTVVDLDDERIDDYILTLYTEEIGTEL